MTAKISIVVALFIGVISATRVNQYSARYNPVSQYYIDADGQDEDYDSEPALYQ